MNGNQNISGVLTELGVSPKYQGYHQMVSALRLCLAQPERLALVTKKVYPAVAMEYHTKWQCVERNMRTVVNTVWINNRFDLESINHKHLTKKPSVSEFIFIVLNYVHTAPEDPKSQEVCDLLRQVC